MEVRPVFRLAVERRGRAVRPDAVLEAALRIDRHPESGDGLHSASHDLALERVEALDLVTGERPERNGRGDLDQPRPEERTESLESVAPQRRVGPRARTALPARIRRRVF